MKETETTGAYVTQEKFIESIRRRTSKREATRITQSETGG
jgi:hypothetical protein